MIHATWRPNERLFITHPDLPEPIYLDVYNLRTGGALIGVEETKGYRIFERREDVVKRITNNRMDLRGGLS